MSYQRNFLFWFIVTCCLVATSSRAETLVIEPIEVLMGDAVFIRAQGLPPRTLATLKLTGKDQFGHTWQSQATFRTDNQGTLDTKRDAPESGSYRGKDPAGLFWGMTCNGKGKYVSPFAVIPSLAVTSEAQGKILAQKNYRTKGPS